jgi:hypothetical protein
MSMASGHPPQTRSINRSTEAALRGNIIPAPLAGEGQGEGEGMIRPSFLASRRFAPGYPDTMLALGLGYFLCKFKCSNVQISKHKNVFV